MRNLRRAFAGMAWVGSGLLALQVAQAQGPLDVVYLFDTVTNIALDSSGNGFDGFFPNASTEVTASESQFGAGSLYSPSNASAGIRIDLATHPALQSALDSFSFTTWVQLVSNDVTAIRYFRRSGTSGSPDGLIDFFSQSGSAVGTGLRYTFRLTVSTNGGPDTVIGNYWTNFPGTWAQVGVTFDAGQVKFYLNGQQHGSTLISSATNIAALVTGTPIMRSFSSSVTATSGLATYADDWAFLGNRVLTDAEMLGIYTNGLQQFLIPEPSAIALLGTAGGLFLLRWRLR